MTEPAAMAGSDPVQVIAVASGKGGVGKTTVSINLATALANRGRRVMLMDSDVGLADVDIALGLHPTWDLGHVLRGERRLADIVLPGPSGVAVVPSVSGARGIAELSSAQSAGVIAAFSDLPDPPEVLVVDTAAGLAGGTLRFIQAAGEVLIVLCDENTSLHNAYNLIQLLRTRCGMARFRVLGNRIGGGEADGPVLFERLRRFVERDLDVTLHDVGAIPEDPAVRRALTRQQPVVNAFPASPAARAFKRLARRTESWAPPPRRDGGVAFFVERLIRSSNLMQRQSVATL